MSSCDLEIVLENPGAPLKFGDVVRGVVGVSVDADCRCRGLDVTVGWYTHGSGNRAQGGTTVRLFEGEWKRGDKAAHPFEIPVGFGPLPYHGHHLNVDWQVRATADIPWGFDPHADVELSVAGDPSASELFQGPFVQRGLQEGGAGAVFLTVVGLIFAATGAASGLFLLATGVFMAVVLDPISGLVTMLIGGFVPLLFVLVGLGISGFAVRPWLAQRRFGKPELSVHPDRLRGGEELTVRATIAPNRATDVNGVWAVLRAGESVVSGSGTNTHTHTHTVYEERIPLSGPRTFFAGVTVPLDARVRIPRDPAPSFAVHHNTLAWSVELHADVARGFDVVRRYGIEVRP